MGCDDQRDSLAHVPIDASEAKPSPRPSADGWEVESARSKRPRRQDVETPNPVQHFLCVAKYQSSGGRGLKEAVAVFSPAI